MESNYTALYQSLTDILLLMELLQELKKVIILEAPSYTVRYTIFEGNK